MTSHDHGTARVIFGGHTSEPPGRAVPASRAARPGGGGQPGTHTPDRLYRAMVGAALTAQGFPLTPIYDALVAEWRGADQRGTVEDDRPAPADRPEAAH